MSNFTLRRLQVLNVIVNFIYDYPMTKCKKKCHFSVSCMKMYLASCASSCKDVSIYVIARDVIFYCFADFIFWQKLKNAEGGVMCLYSKYSYLYIIIIHYNCFQSVLVMWYRWYSLSRGNYSHYSGTSQFSPTSLQGPICKAFRKQFDFFTDFRGSFCICLTKIRRAESCFMCFYFVITPKIIPLLIATYLLPHLLWLGLLMFLAVEFLLVWEPLKNRNQGKGDIITISQACPYPLMLIMIHIVRTGDQNGYQKDSASFAICSGGL